MRDQKKYVDSDSIVGYNDDTKSINKIIEVRDKTNNDKKLAESIEESQTALSTHFPNDKTIDNYSIVNSGCNGIMEDVKKVGKCHRKTMDGIVR